MLPRCAVQTPSVPVEVLQALRAPTTSASLDDDMNPIYRALYSAMCVLREQYDIPEHSFTRPVRRDLEAQRRPFSFRVIEATYPSFGRATNTSTSTSTPNVFSQRRLPRTAPPRLVVHGARHSSSGFGGARVPSTTSDTSGTARLPWARGRSFFHDDGNGKEDSLDATRRGSHVSAPSRAPCVSVVIVRSSSSSTRPHDCASGGTAAPPLSSRRSFPRPARPTTFLTLRPDHTWIVSVRFLYPATDNQPMNLCIGVGVGVGLGVDEHRLHPRCTHTCLRRYSKSARTGGEVGVGAREVLTFQRFVASWRGVVRTGHGGHEGREGKNNERDADGRGVSEWGGSQRRGYGGGCTGTGNDVEAIGAAVWCMDVRGPSTFTSVVCHLDFAHVDLPNQYCESRPADVVATYLDLEGVALGITFLRRPAEPHLAPPDPCPEIAWGAGVDGVGGGELEDQDEDEDEGRDDYGHDNEADVLVVGKTGEDTDTEDEGTKPRAGGLEDPPPTESATLLLYTSIPPCSATLGSCRRPYQRPSSPFIRAHFAAHTPAPLAESLPVLAPREYHHHLVHRPMALLAGLDVCVDVLKDEWEGVVGDPDAQ
ncbi:hypothetical protein B0H13DRAFT_2329889 [Mycena leptocephala]|nr:hypothetical protein B0H13DRAFT_2329889 [Mycena leptocephala]